MNIERQMAFAAKLADLQDEFDVTEDEMASMCAGIIITICLMRGADPLAFMRWAVEDAAKTVQREPS